MPAIATESVVIPLEAGQRIEGDLHVPERASGLVVFAHGSGSSRFSSRNRAVARSLHVRGLGTLLLDLLTQQEESVDVFTREYRSISIDSADVWWWRLTGCGTGTICSGFQ